jgi:type IV secretion system protein VirD4
MNRVSDREIKKLTNLIDKLDVSNNPIAKALLEDAERGIWHPGKTGVVQKNLDRQEQVRFNLQQALELLILPESNAIPFHSASKSVLLTNKDSKEQKPLIANNSLDNSANLLLGIPTYPEIESCSTSSDREFALHNFTGSETIKHSGEGHLMTVAPTGTGKGRTAIIPNLLHYQGSVVVIDPKGENYAVTARYRREIGHQIIKIDPFGVIDFKSDHLNPLDIFELKNADLETDAQMLAELLSTGNQGTKEPFWDLSARGLLSGLITHIATMYAKSDRHLNSVRKLLMNKEMENSLAKTLDDFGQKMNPMAKDEISAFLNMPSLGTRPSVLASAVSYIKPLMSYAVARTLEKSSFSLNDVVTGKPVSIYIIIPPDKLNSHQGLLRLWIGTLFKAFTSRRQIPKLPTLLLLDECAQLGNFSYLETLITLCRSYGVKVWSFWQDLAQIRQLYPQSWQTIINNCAVLQFFGSKNFKMSQELSELVGVPAKDIRNLPQNEQIIVNNGVPLQAQRFDYLNHLQFKNRFDANPFHDQKSL